VHLFSLWTKAAWQFFWLLSVRAVVSDPDELRSLDAELQQIQAQRLQLAGVPPVGLKPALHIMAAIFYRYGLRV
jgi:hypothetical protein